ncbi:MAG: gliding motility-associated C-terminal domain-containing protein [Chitinophagales bacterium]|nr:gliding motility-associated C-terminal domain-containing protein [Chitinophagales bacterium]
MRKLLFLIILVALMPVLRLHATHIVGGEMNYKDLGNNRYEISLKVYRDCFLGVPPFDNPAKINIFDGGDGTYLGSIFVSLPPFDTIPVQLNDPCLVAPPDVCVERVEYKTTLTLNPAENGYILSYERCCRNNTILNIEIPGDVGGTYYCKIPGTNSGIGSNGNPVYRNFPPVAICANRPIIFDHSAIDPDGDSLVYKLCTPFEGGSTFDPTAESPTSPPFNEVQFSPPYSLSNILGGVPLAIDSKTGLLTGTPNTEGQFVVGVCVEEYRNGVLIGETKRDFQFNIANCNPVVEARFTAPDPECRSNTVQFINSSIGGITYEWNFGDGSAINTTINPSHTFPDTGSYQVTLIVNKGLPCADTLTKTVRVQKKLIKADFTYDQELLCIKKTDTIQFTDLSRDTIGIASWRWRFGDGTVSTLQNPGHVYNTDGTYSVILTVTGVNGCTDEITKVIKVSYAPAFTLPSSLSICNGGSGVQLPLQITGNNLYKWTPSAGLNNPNIKNPIARPDTTTTYTVTIKTPKTGGDTCIQTASVKVIVVDTFATYNLEDVINSCVREITINPVNAQGELFLWSSNSNFTDTLNANLSSPVLNITQNVATKKYYFKIKIGDCYSKTDSVTVNVNIISFDKTLGEYCKGSSGFVKLIVNYNGNYDLNWLINGNVVPDAGSDGILDINEQTSGYVVFQVETKGIVCTYIDSIPYRVFDSIPDFTLIDSVQNCGNPVVIQPNAPQGYTYLWSTSSDFSNILNIDTTQPVLNINQTSPVQTYYFMVKSGACFEKIDSVVSTINIINWSVTNAAYCSGGEGNVAVQISFNGDYELFWIVNGQEIPDANSDGVFTTNQTQSGFIPFHIVTEQVACNYYDSALVVVYDNPVVNATVNQTLVDAGTTVQLGAEVTPQGNYTYEWEPADIVSNSSIFNPTSVVNVPTWYYVTVTNATGCQGIDSIFVDIIKKQLECFGESLFLPSAFTPNGDNRNDVYKVRSNQPLESMTLIIFNRWGEKVFESNDQSFGWDGTFKGKDAVGDSFAYYFEGKCANGEKIIKQGNITLIR